MKQSLEIVEKKLRLSWDNFIDMVWSVANCLACFE